MMFLARSTRGALVVCCLRWLRPNRYLLILRSSGRLLLEKDAEKHSRAIADKFSSALAAAEHAAAQARDDDADSKASRTKCVAGLSSLLDGLLSAAPSERPLMADVEKLQWLNAYRTTNLARFFRFVDFDDMKSERTERSRRARAFRAKSLPKTPDARRRHLQRRSPDSPAAAARQLEFEKRPRSSGRLW